MATSPLTIHGRLAFNTIDSLVERLRNVASLFPIESEFHAYLTTHSGKRYYGLDYAELMSRYQDHAGNVQTISTSCSTSKGKSVSVNLRFPKDAVQTMGQFVISTDSAFISGQMESMLRGVWKPLPKEEQAKNQKIGALIAFLIEAKEERIRRKKEAQERELTRRLQEIIHIKDRFEFDHKVSADTLIRLQEQISKKYMNQAPFNIRLVTISGDPYSNIGAQGLRRFLDKRRKMVLRIYMDAATAYGELVDLMFDFDPKSQKNRVEAEITSAKAKEIQKSIRKMLEQKAEAPPPPKKRGKTAMVHEMFRFDESQFSLKNVLSLLADISQKYLQKASPTAFLSTIQGKTFPALNYRELQSVYRQIRPDVSFLLFSISQARTGQTFSLMFQFQAPGMEAYGSLSMMWANAETHSRIKQLIWERLNLKPYRTEQKSKTANLLKVPQRRMLINPIFNNRDFIAQPSSSMVCMPLEAYWSDSIWVHIKQTMGSLGFSSIRSGAIFNENMLEGVWTSINEVDLFIADLTYKHPSVFYQLGIAHTLGKPILIISQHERDIPIDFRQFPHIVYNNNIEGLDLLANQMIKMIKKVVR